MVLWQQNETVNYEGFDAGVIWIPMSGLLYGWLCGSPTFSSRLSSSPKPD
jgi:hypothetical protein